MQANEETWVGNGKLPFTWDRAHVSAAVSTMLTAIGLSQAQKELVAANPLRSYLADLKHDMGRKSQKTALGLGVEVVVGFIRDALVAASDAWCTLCIDSSPRIYSRGGARCHVTAFVVHCPFVRSEIAHLFPAVFRLEAHASSHTASQLLDLVVRAVTDLGIERPRVLSLMTDNASVSLCSAVQKPACCDCACCRRAGVMKLLQTLFRAPVKAFCIAHVLGLVAAALLGPFKEIR